MRRAGDLTDLSSDRPDEADAPPRAGIGICEETKAGLHDTDSNGSVWAEGQARVATSSREPVIVITIYMTAALLLALFGVGIVRFATPNPGSDTELLALPITHPLLSSGHQHSVDIDPEDISQSDRLASYTAALSETVAAFERQNLRVWLESGLLVGWARTASFPNPPWDVDADLSILAGDLQKFDIAKANEDTPARLRFSTISERQRGFNVDLRAVDTQFGFFVDIFAYKTEPPTGITAERAATLDQTTRVCGDCGHQCHELRSLLPLQTLASSTLKFPNAVVQRAWEDGFSGTSTRIPGAAERVLRVPADIAAVLQDQYGGDTWREPYLTYVFWLGIHQSLLAKVLLLLHIGFVAGIAIALQWKPRCLTKATCTEVITAIAWWTYTVYAALTFAVSLRWASPAILLTKVGNPTLLAVLWLSRDDLKAGHLGKLSRWLWIAMWLEVVVALWDFSPWLLHHDVRTFVSGYFTTPDPEPLDLDAQQSFESRFRGSKSWVSTKERCDAYAEESTALGAT